MRRYDEPIEVRSAGNAFLDMRVDGLVLAGTMPVTDSIREAAQRLPTVVAGMRDLNLREIGALAPLVALIVALNLVMINWTLTR